MSNHLDNLFPCKLSTRAPIQLFRSKERRLSEDGCLIMGSPIKKLLSCIESTVVKTEKVINKVAVEAGFPCLPTI